MKQKPKIGAPCNGCGICCHIQLCRVGAFLLKKVNNIGDDPVKGKCPALLLNSDGSYSCGLVKCPKKFIKSSYREDVISNTVAFLIGVNKGCDELGYSEDVQEELRLMEFLEKFQKDENWKLELANKIQLLNKF